MRLDHITAEGFRNLSGRIDFPSSVTLVVGENNAGKSNVIEALRTLTQPHDGTRFSRWITADDFRHDDRGEREVSLFRLEAILTRLTPAERSLMVTCLAPSIGSDAAKLTLEASISMDGRVEVTWLGGDSLQPGVESTARSALVHSYLPPLRDAASELRPGRDNKLVHLLSALAPVGGVEYQEVLDAAVDSNTKLSAVGAVTKAQTEIKARLDDMVGSAFSQVTSFAFADPSFERVLNNVRARAGDILPLELVKNGLGYNNLLYMANLLAAVEQDPSDGIHLILIEEPEAHLHPQLQDLLMRYFDRRGQGASQVIVTTHSPNFSSSAGVENITVLTRSDDRRTCVGCTPARFALAGETINHLKRFLDVTKASLFYARAVMLVEGIAEQLLLPAIARGEGIDLAKEGISIVNVGGLSFGPFAELFSDDRIQRRCAIISDSDPDEGDEETGPSVLSATAKKLKTTENDVLKVFLATNTFEWDLVAAGNWEIMMKALSELKPRTAQKLIKEDPGNNQQRADMFLAAIKRIKGPFSQALAAALAAEGESLTTPSYLSDALKFVAGPRSVTRDEPTK